MKQIFNFCRPYLKKQRGLLVLLIFLFILVSLTSVIGPYITGSFIDSLLEDGASAMIKKYVIAFAAIALIEFVLGFVCERLYIKVQMRSGYALNADAIHHVQNVQYGFSADKNTAFLNQQINNDANMSVIFCITVLQNIISNVLTLIVPLIVIFLFEPWLGIAMIALNILYYVLYLVFRNPVYKADYAFMDEQARFFSKLDSQLCSVKFIQTQGIAKGFISRLERSFKILQGRALKSQLAEYGFAGSDVLIKTGANILVFIVGGAAVIAGKMSIGELTIVMSYFAMSLSATQYFFGLGKQIQSTRVSCDRLKLIFGEPEQTNGSFVPDDIDRIECRGVSFGYDEDKVLEGLDLTLSKGGIYALAGENGSGKSTLLNLILGLFIDKYEGAVEYNGMPIESLDMREMRRLYVGVSEQEPMLLEETLRFNLTLDDNAQLPEEAFGKLCEMLHLNDYLSSLPNGLDTVINDSSSNLSGGEKQKLSIMRALLKNPKLLMLDEPTSAMDKESRESFISYLNERRSDMIVLISTHDPELLDICDEIIRLG